MDSSLEDHKESKKGKSVSCKLKKKDFCMYLSNYINTKMDLVFAMVTNHSALHLFSHRNMNTTLLI